MLLLIMALKYHLVTAISVLCERKLNLIRLCSSYDQMLDFFNELTAWKSSLIIALDVQSVNCAFRAFLISYCNFKNMQI